LCGEQATRKDIIKALRGLVESTRPGDVVVIYFSGHGGQATFGETSGAWHFIVPFDHPLNGGAFRGILDVELSEFAHAIADMTTNLTVILDCCHAATTIRHHLPVPTTLELVRKAIEPRAFAQSVLADAGVTLDLQRALDAEGHPHIVRVVASSAEYYAYEGRGDDGRIGGLLTIELLKTLRAIPADHCWDGAIRLVRERIRARHGAQIQRPEIEGPCGRELFGLRQSDRRAALTYWVDERGQPGLQAGWFHGIGDGDEVEIIDLEPCRSLAARVTVARADTATLVFDPGVTWPTPGSTAFVRRVKQLEPIVVNGETAELAPVCATVDSFLRLYASLEPNEDADSLGFRVADGQLLLCRGGIAIRRPRQSNPRALAALLEDLDALARARAFFRACKRAQQLPENVIVEARVFVEADDRPRRELPPTGGAIVVGERVWIDLHNSSGPHTPRVWVNVVDVGVSGRLSILNGAQPAGVELPLGQRRWVGNWHGATNPGLAMFWPDDVELRERSREALWIVVSSRPIDLRALTTDAPPTEGLCREPQSELRAGPELAIRILRCDFDLVPNVVVPNVAAPPRADDE
jgi:hypothetical protein